MLRFGFAGLLALLPGWALADCATYQQAYQVPPPASGVSEDPAGPLGCTKEALAMFEVNLVAKDRAQAVANLSDLHGAWLGDRMLAPLLGVTVAGQELLIIGPGEEGDLSVTQLWLKAAVPGVATALWGGDGEYLGTLAKAQLTRLEGGRFEVSRFGEAITYGTQVLEFERSYDLLVKSHHNHFELPLEFLRHEDVLVLKGERRDPRTREIAPYVNTYTRVAPGAAETALAFVAVFERSQTRFLDCLAHQITAGQGPLFDMLGERDLDGLKGMMSEVIRLSARREALMAQFSTATDPTIKDSLRDELQTEIEAYVTFTQDETVRGLFERVSKGADGVCPSLR